MILLELKNILKNIKISEDKEKSYKPETPTEKIKKNKEKFSPLMKEIEDYIKHYSNAPTHLGGLMIKLEKQDKETLENIKEKLLEDLQKGTKNIEGTKKYLKLMKEHKNPYIAYEEYREKYRKGDVIDFADKDVAKYFNHGTIIYKINKLLGKDPYDGIDKDAYHGVIHHVFHPSNFLSMPRMSNDPKNPLGHLDRILEDTFRHVDDPEIRKSLHESYENYLEKQKQKRSPDTYEKIYDNYKKYLLPILKNK